MKKTAAALIALLLLAGCDNTAKNMRTPIGELKQGENGMTYVLTCVEGHRFVAVQTAYDFWSLSGPVGECES